MDSRYILEIGSAVHAGELNVGREGKRGLDAVGRLVGLFTEMRGDRLGGEAEGIGLLGREQSYLCLVHVEA